MPVRVGRWAPRRNALLLTQRELLARRQRQCAKRAPSPELDYILRLDSQSHLASLACERSVHLPFLEKAAKAIADEGRSQISHVCFAVACAGNRGLPKPGKEEKDHEAGNETGQSETGSGIDRR